MYNMTNEQGSLIRMIKFDSDVNIWRVAQQYPRWCRCNHKLVMFKLISKIDGLNLSRETALGLMHVTDG